jgi:hypothetical protein
LALGWCKCFIAGYLSYGAFFWGFGISFRQATAAAFIGSIGSFHWWELAHLPGKRSNAQRWFCRGHLWSSKAWRSSGSTFLSDLRGLGDGFSLTCTLLATGTVFSRIRGVDNTPVFNTRIYSRSSPLPFFGGVLGFLTVIMKLQKLLTILTIVMTLVYVFANRRYQLEV